MCPLLTGAYHLGHLEFLLDCVNQSYDPSTVQWQWLLGRITFLLKIIEEYPQGLRTDIDARVCLKPYVETFSSNTGDICVLR